jgi:hypothetical protein
MTYELLVSAARVPSERAAERTLECLARLTPRPARIALVDWSHGRHPDLRVAGAPNRHGLARRRSAALNDLMEMADEVWSENLAQQKRCDPIGAEDWCCQCKTKAWGIGECARRGAARMLYMQWGDVMTAGAPQRLLDALDACPPATFAWLQVLRGDWRGRVRAPLQFVYRRATVMADAGWASGSARPVSAGCELGLMAPATLLLYPTRRTGAAAMAQRPGTSSQLACDEHR